MDRARRDFAAALMRVLRTHDQSVRTTWAPPAKADLVVVYLLEGDVGLLTGDDAVWVDLDLGCDGRGDWAALTTRDMVDIVANNSGAKVSVVEDWNGSTFGDGNGCVRLDEEHTLVYSSGFAPTYVPEGYTVREADPFDADWW